MSAPEKVVAGSAEKGGDDRGQASPLVAMVGEPRDHRTALAAVATSPGQRADGGDR